MGVAERPLLTAVVAGRYSPLILPGRQWIVQREARPPFLGEFDVRLLEAVVPGELEMIGARAFGCRPLKAGRGHANGGALRRIHEKGGSGLAFTVKR